MGCFRGSLKLPSLYDISKGNRLSKITRLQQRRKIPGTINSALLRACLSNEAKIERVIRSKSGLDGLFELCPMSPWRASFSLKWEKDRTNQHPDGLLYLDFKNFYPSLLCSNEFPDPKSFKIYQTKSIPIEPGLLRAKLHLKDKRNERIKQIHPFQLQSGEKSCPFYLNNCVETLIHTNEVKIWLQFFDVEPIEAIVSKKSINHPLHKRVSDSIHELEELRKVDPQNPKIQELKLIINSATTVPKIGQDKKMVSPYGVHCFASQIVSNGRAILMEVIHTLLNIPQTSIIQINTDGFLLAYKSKGALKHVLSSPFVGTNPGQLMPKAQGNRALVLGPNVWWLVNNNDIVYEAGTGRGKDTPLNFQTPIPEYVSYRDNKGVTHEIDLLHLSDFRHKLNHQTLERQKFYISAYNGLQALTPFKLIEQEKQRSWDKTKRVFKEFRETLQGPDQP